MATSARIGVLNPDGSIRSVSCKENGSPKDLGKVLLSYFTQLFVIDALFQNGFVYGAPGLGLDMTKDCSIRIENDLSIKEFLKETQEDCFYIFNPVTEQWFWTGNTLTISHHIPRLHMKDCK